VDCVKYWNGSLYVIYCEVREIRGRQNSAWLDFCVFGVINDLSLSSRIFYACEETLWLPVFPLAFQSKRPCQSPGNLFQYSRECDQGQQSPARPAFTGDLRKAVTNRVSDSGTRPPTTVPRSAALDKGPQLSTINSQPYQSKRGDL
jgi:hypothetical protein